MLAGRAQKLGEFVRYETSLPPRLSELAILVVARYWTAQFEWTAHKAEALKAELAKRGVARERLEKLKAPAGLDLGAITPDEIAISILAEIVAVRRGRDARGAAPQSA